MRRTDREMPEEFAFDVLDKCDYAVLAMTDTEGLPYCIPFSPARDGKTLYFHCAGAGMKIDSMKASPDVCVTCAANVKLTDSEFTVYYDSAVFKGRASEVTDTDEKIRALRLICEKYSPANMHAFDNAVEKSMSVTYIWRIDVTEATGKQKK